MSLSFLYWLGLGVGVVENQHVYSTGPVVYKRLHIFACDRLFADFCPYTSKFFVQPLMCVQNGKKSLKSSKIAKIVKNRKKWSKIAKIVKNRQKIAINRQKSLIIVEISNMNHRRELQWLSLSLPTRYC